MREFVASVLVILVFLQFVVKNLVITTSKRYSQERKRNSHLLRRRGYSGIHLYANVDNEVLVTSTCSDISIRI